MFGRTYKRIEPVPGTATRRRELRQAIRHALGVSSERPPDAERLMRAVGKLAELVELTAPGYGLRLIAPGGPDYHARRALDAIREEG